MEATSTKPLANWAGTLITALVAGVSVLGIVLMQSNRLKQIALNLDNPKQAEQQEEIRLNLLKNAPTFGFDNIIASWTFLNFLQYFGDEPARLKTGYRLNAEYFDIITRLDPRFVESYLFVSTSISYYQGDPELAVKLMKRGTIALSPQNNPKAFLVWRLMGLDQLLLLGDVPGAIHSYEMASTWTQGTPYAQIGAVFQQTADFLKRDPDSVSARFQAWSDVFMQAVQINDKLTLSRATQALLAMGAKPAKNEKGQLYFIPPPKPKPAQKLNQPKKLPNQP
ncbi:MAG: hypothetical protein KME16_05750 [Scytolyngbya sp. HA4215-MV1]|jgi:hypothetical protein|nr:hypothetical protein [Scytolyngbya sp. HA4215-MV1]